MKLYKIILLIFCFCVLQNKLFAQFSNGGHVDIFANNDIAYRSATVAGSDQNGQANLVRSQGQIALDFSMANINNQFAFSLGLDNNLKYVETYFKKRQINRYYKDLEDWQSRYRAYLKKHGGLTREDIEYIYYRTR